MANIWSGLTPGGQVIDPLVNYVKLKYGINKLVLTSIMLSPKGRDQENKKVIIITSGRGRGGQ